MIPFYGGTHCISGDEYPLLMNGDEYSWDYDYDLPIYPNDGEWYFSGVAMVMTMTIRTMSLLWMYNMGIWMVLMGYWIFMNVDEYPWDKWDPFIPIDSHS